MLLGIYLASAEHPRPSGHSRPPGGCRFFRCSASSRCSGPFVHFRVRSLEVVHFPDILDALDVRYVLYILDVPDALGFPDVLDVLAILYISDVPEFLDVSDVLNGLDQGLPKLAHQVVSLGICSVS